MTVVRLGDFCCQAGNKQLNLRRFRQDDLLLNSSDGLDLIFSPLGNLPLHPKIALVGITPGGQWKRFAKYLSRYGVAVAARKAAFAGARQKILKLLKAHGLADALGIKIGSNPDDLFEGEHVLTTSLAKCCLISNDKRYKYSAPDLVATSRAQYCIEHRFMSEIKSRHETLTHLIIFGQAAEDATSTCVAGTTVKERLQAMGLRILRLPHFAQNQQQIKIYGLDPSEYDAYFRCNPQNQRYRAKACQLAKATIAEVRRLKSAAGSSS